MAPYQQSFRIDDLLTRKVCEQQPGHFCSPLPAVPAHHLPTTTPNGTPHPLQPPPSGPGMGTGAVDKAITCQTNVKVIL